MAVILSLAVRANRLLCSGTTSEPSLGIVNRASDGARESVLAVGSKVWTGSPSTASWKREAEILADRWLYLFRAVDSQGQTVDFFLSETRDREATKRFLKKASRIRTTDLHLYSPGMGCEVIQRRCGSCRRREVSRGIVDSALAAIAITESNPITAT